jgi:hypothetical protein
MPFSTDSRRVAPLSIARAAKLIVFCGIAGGWINWSEDGCAAERWTSLDGSRTVEAEFVGKWGNSVVLELPGQRRVAVSEDDLIAESRIQARRMDVEQQRRRSETRQQILADAKEAAAPAPTPLPQPPIPPAYQKLSAGGGLLGQLQWLDQQNRNGHGLVAAFDSLPPNYQADLERLLRLTVAKLDLQALQQMVQSIHSVGDLVVTRQRWMFSHPRLETIDSEAKQTLQGALLSIAGVIRDGMDPRELKLEALSTTPLRNWLVELDQRVAPHLASMNDQFELLGIERSSYEVKSEKDGKATVEMTNGDLKQSMNFVTVDAMWMPEEWTAERWAESMKAWETSLAETADGSLLGGGMAQMVPMFITPVVQPAAEAKSAREFHAAMDGWIAMASPLIAQMDKLGIGRPKNAYGSGYSGMDAYEQEMMDMEMEMEMDMNDEYDQQYEQEMNRQ